MKSLKEVLREASVKFAANLEIVLVQWIREEVLSKPSPILVRSVDEEYVTSSIQQIQATLRGEREKKIIDNFSQETAGLGEISKAFVPKKALVETRMAPELGKFDSAIYFLHPGMGKNYYLLLDGDGRYVARRSRKCEITKIARDRGFHPEFRISGFQEAMQPPSPLLTWVKEIEHLDTFGAVRDLYKIFEYTCVTQDQVLPALYLYRVRRSVAGIVVCYEAWELFAKKPIYKRNRRGRLVKLLKEKGYSSKERVG